MPRRRRRHLVLVFGAVFSTAVACSPEPGPEQRAEHERIAAKESVDGGPSADRVEVLSGVPDRGRDPAVVAIDLDGEGLCSGALISPRLVLTARHCVSRTASLVSCPPSGVQVFGDRSPSEPRILVGEDVASARHLASGIAIVAPSGVTLCDADIAVLVLDEPIVVAKPLPLRSRGPAAGDRVRAVGFGRPSDDDPSGRKLLREHVEVLSVSTAEFTVGEATCLGDSGGPALDEDTGEILGVVSRGGPKCEGPGVHNIYTRVDTYSWLMEEAFAKVSEIELQEKVDAGANNPTAKPARKGTKQKPPSDVGGPCTTGHDCAAGVCITEPTPATDDDESVVRQYCSRPCGPGDRCPTRYHCKPVAGLETGDTACINVR